MKKNFDLEIKIGKAISLLETAQKEFHTNPKFAMKLLNVAENTIQSAYITLVTLTGGVVKE